MRPDGEGVLDASDIEGHHRVCAQALWSSSPAQNSEM